MRLAPSFQEVMRPSRVLLMIASSEEATIEANRADSAASSSRSLMSTNILMAPTSWPSLSNSGGWERNEWNAGAVRPLGDRLHGPDWPFPFERDCHRTLVMWHWRAVRPI